MVITEITFPQDSLMALFALRKFALADKNRALYKMAVNQKISSLKQWEPRIWIVPDNYSTLSKTVVRFPRVNVPRCFSLFFPTISTTESNELLFIGTFCPDT